MADHPRQARTAPALRPLPPQRQRLSWAACAALPRGSARLAPTSLAPDCAPPCRRPPAAAAAAADPLLSLYQAEQIPLGADGAALPKSGDGLYVGDGNFGSAAGEPMSKNQLKKVRAVGCWC